MKNWNAILNHINETINQESVYSSVESVSGGDINEAYHLITQSNNKQYHYFIKTNQASLFSMFKAEYHALKLMQSVDSLRVPQPICMGVEANTAYLVMSYIPLTSRGNQYKLGQAIAKMHQIKQTKFGWAINGETFNNTIGSSPQFNQLTEHWQDFWINQRILPQLDLLEEKGRLTDSLSTQAELFIQQLERYFINNSLGENHSPSPSLLHGDLWGGNIAFDEKGEPVIFDPALYYGDRETDIAMTELFGGFNQDFYQGYQEIYPLADSYKMRKPVYNLYHILNHANLFGGSYINQAEHLLNQLTS